ncbi:MAG: acyltransferase [Pirellulales bacterium]|nr:acyltransferase [Pirellulales bacterium]
MRDIQVGVAQFEHRDADKTYNLERIAELSRHAAQLGAAIVSFHECSITGYTFLQSLDRAQLNELAERVPDGPSTHALVDIAREHDVVVMAGLIEIDDVERMYNTYVVVGPDGYISSFRKLHPFINPQLDAGSSHQVIDLLGMKAGFLICYDNNLPENARITTMMGAEVIFAPHVTGCTPSPMPGRGVVNAGLWHDRKQNPEALRAEFDGPKGRAWLMRWLPARAWENGVYVVFTNPIGVDGDTIKPGLSMVIDPFGEVQAECRNLGDDLVVTTLYQEKLDRASGQRYLRARRPEIYQKLVEPHPNGRQSVTDPGWKLEHKDR